MTTVLTPAPVPPPAPVPALPPGPVRPAGPPPPRAAAGTGAVPPPAPGVCDVWLLPVARRDGWTDLLSPPERARLAELAHGPVHDAFQTSRGAQRLVLARYLGGRPHDLPFARDCAHCRDPRHGRPYLPGAPVDFSVSHTDDWLLLAVVGTGRVGADLDTLTAGRDTERLAAVTMTPAELTAHRRLPRSRRRPAFLRAWVRKEAAMKVTGLGLAAPPPLLDVAGPRATAPTVPRWPADPPHLTDLTAPAAHAAAVATTHPLHTLRPRTL